MADEKNGTWDDNLRRLLESYKWPIVAVVVLVGLTKGWWEVAAVDWLVTHVERIVASLRG